MVPTTTWPKSVKLELSCAEIDFATNQRRSTLADDHARVVAYQKFHNVTAHCTCRMLMVLEAKANEGGGG